jgi:3',5'-cyclic AMP phosphodiesterase CpdA
VRIVVHLSDLHFGRIDHALLAPLARRLHALRPHLVVVSGDLTQRAKSAEFRDARRFLDSLPGPLLVVPGNHDIPYYNLFQRFFQPLAKYRRYVSPDIEPMFADDELAVVGLNTARSSVFKGGRINAAQIERARERLCRLDERVTKMVVTHHPFDLPVGVNAGHHERKLVGRAREAMAMFASCGADLLLAGHLHTSHTGDTAARYKIDDYSALVVQAGTATSLRGRGEANSFNVLHIERPHVRIERYGWTGTDFLLAGTEVFTRTPGGWQRS